MKRNLSDTIRWINESITKIGLNSKVKKKFDKVDAIDNISDYVDLGLPSGNMWAKCNVGAISEEEYGDYFTFDEANSQYSLPSTEDYKELIENTSCEVGKNGVVFTSKINGKSILFPLSGHCDSDGFEFGKKRWAYYWTSTEYTSTEYNDACYVFFTNLDPLRNITFITKYTKTTIRTISKKKVNENLGLGLNQKAKAKFGKVDPIKNIDTEYIDLGLPSGTLWKSCNVGAKEPFEIGEYIQFDSVPNIVNYREVPTSSDYEELIHYTSRRWDPDKKGVWLISKTNGNEIFFPACGFKSFSQGYKYNIDVNDAGYYWISTEYNGSKGKCFCFDISDTEISQLMKVSSLCVRSIKR